MVGSAVARRTWCLKTLELVVTMLRARLSKHKTSTAVAMPRVTQDDALPNQWFQTSLVERRRPGP